MLQSGLPEPTNRPARRRALLQIAEARELPAGVTRFDLRQFILRQEHKCVACLAGCYKLVYPEAPFSDAEELSDHAAQHFGLTEQQVLHVFYARQGADNDRPAVAERLRAIMTQLGDFNGA